MNRKLPCHLGNLFKCLDSPRSGIMHNPLLLFLLCFALLQPTGTWAAITACSDLLNVEKRLLDSEDRKRLCDYQGKVILVVNTASQCGFTPQYEGLEKLYAKYKQQGLMVLGFPSNDFMGQEPGTETEIAAFCRLTYGVKFPMFAKTKVKQGTRDPFYQNLAKAADNTYPKWNFYKYLIDRDGKMADVYSSLTKPDDEELVNKIEALLKQPARNTQATPVN